MITFVCRVIDDNHVSVNGKQITIVSNRDPTKLPWAEMVSPSTYLMTPSPRVFPLLPSLCYLDSCLRIRQRGLGLTACD